MSFIKFYLEDKEKVDTKIYELRKVYLKKLGFTKDEIKLIKQNIKSLEKVYICDYEEDWCPFHYSSNSYQTQFLKMKVYLFLNLGKPSKSIYINLNKIKEMSRGENDKYRWNGCSGRGLK